MTDRPRRIAISTAIAVCVVALIQAAVLAPRFVPGPVTLTNLLVSAVIIALHVGFNFYFRGVTYMTGDTRLAGWRFIVVAGVLVLYPQGVPYALSVTGPGENDLGCLAFIGVWWVLTTLLTLLLLKTGPFAAAMFSFLAVFLLGIPTALFAGALIAMFAP